MARLCRILILRRKFQFSRNRAEGSESALLITEWQVSAFHGEKERPYRATACLGRDEK